MNTTTSRPRLCVTADGGGVVAHAGSRLLADLAEATGLQAAFREALAPCRQRRGGHDPGRVAVDVAVMLADGGESISDLAVLRDQPKLFGAVASPATAWRVLDGIDAGALSRLRSARAAARELAWAQHAETRRVFPQAKAAGRVIPGLVLDIDASIVLCHSEKQDATPTWKKTFGYQCAMRRSVVSPVQPEGTRKEVPGSDDLPRSETVRGTRACQETGGRAEALRAARQGTRVTRRKLDCLNPNLQPGHRRPRRNDAWNRRRALRRLDGVADAPSGARAIPNEGDPRR